MGPKEGREHLHPRRHHETQGGGGRAQSTRSLEHLAFRMGLLQAQPLPREQQHLAAGSPAVPL